MVVQVMSTAFKIVLGLVQVVSKQPEVLKEDYPGLMWDSEWLNVFSFGERTSCNSKRMIAASLLIVATDTQMLRGYMYGNASQSDFGWVVRANSLV
jgi:hypothetical protein